MRDSGTMTKNQSRIREMMGILVRGARLAEAAEYSSPILLIAQHHRSHHARIGVRAMPGVTVKYQQWGVWLVTAALLLHASITACPGFEGLRWNGNGATRSMNSLPFLWVVWLALPFLWTPLWHRSTGGMRAWMGRNDLWWLLVWLFIGGTLAWLTAGMLMVWPLGLVFLFLAPRSNSWLSIFFGLLQRFFLRVLWYQKLLIWLRRHVRRSPRATPIFYVLGFGLLIWPVYDPGQSWRYSAILLIATLASVLPPMFLYSSLRTVIYDADPETTSSATERQRPSDRDIESIRRAVHECHPTRSRIAYWRELLLQLVAPTRARTAIAPREAMLGLRDALARFILLRDLLSEDRRVQRLLLFLYPTFGAYIILLWAVTSGWFASGTLIFAGWVWALYTVLVILYMCNNMPERLSLDEPALKRLPPFLAPTYAEYQRNYSADAVALMLNELLLKSIPIILTVMFIGYLQMLSPSESEDFPRPALLFSCPCNS